MIRALLGQLAAHGHDVVAIGGDEVELDRVESVEAAFTAACGDRAVDVVVHADVPASAAVPGALVDLDVDGWDERCEGIVRSTLLVFQAAHRRLTRGGAVVLVLPSISLTGAAGLSAWSAAAEAQRVMAKVAARRWGSCGITVNVVSVPPTLLVEAPDPELAALNRTKAPPALGGDAASPDAAADLVCLLTSPDARTLTGSTLVADGGLLMVP
jgi:3-oxoacyl-[acyl-carrier protein] reductase